MLQITLELNRPAFTPDQSPQATVTLTNAGPGQALVNRRLVLNHPAELEECRDVYLHLRDQAGAELPFDAFLRVSEPTLNDFVSLAPGESIKKTYNLQTYYTLARPGRYSIQAFYENVFSPSTGEAWKGKLESGVVEIALDGS